MEKLRKIVEDTDEVLSRELRLSISNILAESFGGEKLAAARGTARVALKLLDKDPGQDEEFVALVRDASCVEEGEVEDLLKRLVAIRDALRK